MNTANTLLQSYFKKATFLSSANHLSDLPRGSHIEIAFAGRSNAGKSSALNLITSQSSLARTSKTPGRTQLINLFKLDDLNYLIDLPGYGYAKVPEKMRLHWKAVLQSYFEKRENLVGLILLMDSRHPFTELDCQMLDWCQSRHLATHILLTKSDKLNNSEKSLVLKESKAFLEQEYTDESFNVSVQLFSATKKSGLNEVWQILASWLKK